MRSWLLSDDKKKLTEVIDRLEETKKKSKAWKDIIDKNEEKFNEIKSQIKIKQQELRDLISKKNSLKLSKEEFEKKVDEVQDELSELEMKIYNMRLKR